MNIKYLIRKFKIPGKIFNSLQTLWHFCLFMGRLARFSNPQYQAFRKIIKDLNSLLAIDYLIGLRDNPGSKPDPVVDNEYGNIFDCTCCDSSIYQEKYSKHEPKFITNKFTAHFGHTRLVTILLQSKILELTTNPLIVLCSRISNSWLYEQYLSPLVPVIKLDDATVSLVETIYPSRIASIETIPLHNSLVEFKTSIEVVQQEWNSHFNQPLLKISEDDLNFGMCALKEYGFLESDWFVSLSTRNSKRYAFERNCDSSTYIEAIQVILKAGGWVFHMGKFDTQPIDFQHPRFIDLLDKHCERLDVFLLSAARFHIGAASGISEIPNLFGTPTLWTNVPDLALQPTMPNSLTIPKLNCVAAQSKGHWSTALGFDMPPHRSVREFRDNTSDEIANACQELLCGLPKNGTTQNLALSAFASKGVPLHYISEYFLSKHSYLFGKL